MKIAHADWAREPGNPEKRWHGSVDGERLGTSATVLFYTTDEVGGGPPLHVHDYDEIFIVRQGRARFFVGDEEIEAEAGDVLLGPAGVPHRFVNLGPGRLETTDVHVAPRWEQTNLDGPAWEKPPGG